MIKHVHAESGMDCIIQCVVFPDKSCRSANYNKTATAGGEKNCELLKTVHSEEDAGSLKRNETFDHYIILSPERETQHADSSSTTLPVTETISTTTQKKTGGLTIQPTTNSTANDSRPRSTTSKTQPTDTFTKNQDNSTPRRTNPSTTQPQLKNKSTLQRKTDVTTTQAIS
ncbi:Hypothetical predicted protein [Paramuricea clavata]|uniref:Apple domain-containing protein n=1 Tax=Paramuricea clavata TaxID=317549 RepID=A0A6S7H605_PARCT|nr:Hypothetical predicted protein [Paramuricea clavata]